MSGGMDSASFGSLPSSAAYMSDGSGVMDKHRRNGHMGHVLNNVEAQLMDLRCPLLLQLTGPLLNGWRNSCTEVCGYVREKSPTLR